jgi:hypothetical protein
MSGIYLGRLYEYKKDKTFMTDFENMADIQLNKSCDIIFMESPIPLENREKTVEEMKLELRKYTHTHGEVNFFNLNVEEKENEDEDEEEEEVEYEDEEEVEYEDEEEVEDEKRTLLELKEKCNRFNKIWVKNISTSFTIINYDSFTEIHNIEDFICPIISDSLLQELKDIQYQIDMNPYYFRIKNLIVSGNLTNLINQKSDGRLAFRQDFLSIDRLETIKNWYKCANAIGNNISSDMCVYRWQQHKADIIGETVVQPIPFSTSINKSTAIDWRKADDYDIKDPPKCCLFKIHVPSKTPLTYYGGNQLESILPACEMKVINKQYFKGYIDSVYKKIIVFETRITKFFNERECTTLINDMLIRD